MPHSRLSDASWFPDTSSPASNSPSPSPGPLPRQVRANAFPCCRSLTSAHRNGLFVALTVRPSSMPCSACQVGPLLRRRPVRDPSQLLSPLPPTSPTATIVHNTSPYSFCWTSTSIIHHRFRALPDLQIITAYPTVVPCQYSSVSHRILCISANPHFQSFLNLPARETASRSFRLCDDTSSRTILAPQTDPRP